MKEFVFVRLDGREQPLAGLPDPLSLTDDLLPIRFVVAPSLSDSLQMGSGPGEFGRDNKVSRSDGYVEFYWHPFARTDSKGVTSHHKRSYGQVSLLMGASGDEARLTVDIKPSGISSRQLAAMRRTLARVASELVRTAEHGVTTTPVGVLASRPREPAEVRAQLARFAEPVVNSVRWIAMNPYVCVLRRAPARPGTVGTPTLDMGAIDTPENRFVAQAVRRWARMFDDCASAAETAASSALDEVELAQIPGSDKLSRGLVDRRNSEHAEFLELARRARHSAAELRRAAGRLLRLKEAHVPVGLTPKIARNGHYLRVFKADRKIRRECALATPLRDASKRDTLASFLYERWVLFALHRLLSRLGYESSAGDWTRAVRLGVYEVCVQPGVPIRYSKVDQGVTLEVVYEPSLVAMKKSGSGSSQDRGIRTLRKQPSVPARAFTVGPGTRPDYLVLIRVERLGSEPAFSLLIGDAVFAPISDYDDGVARQDSCRAVESKATKVKDNYASKAWVVLDDGGIVRAIRHLGVVVFPGPPDVESHFDEVEDVVLLPLRPNAGEDDDEACVEEEARAATTLSRLLEEAVEAAKPSSEERIEQVVGQLRYI